MRHDLYYMDSVLFVATTMIVGTKIGFLLLDTIEQLPVQERNTLIPVLIALCFVQIVYVTWITEPIKV